MSNKSHYSTVTIREDFYILARAIAEEKGIPTSNIIEEAIESYFNVNMPQFNG